MRSNMACARLDLIWKCADAAILCVAVSLPLNAQTSQSFHFESFETLDDMQKFIEESFPLGSFRNSLRRTFVDDGKATLKLHPTQKGVEKYIYDINLCD